MKVRLTNLVITCDVELVDGPLVPTTPIPPPLPPVVPPVADPPVLPVLPKGYNSDPAVALEMLRAAMMSSGLSAIDVQGRGVRIVAALTRRYPALEVYVNPKTDAVVWPGFGSIDCTIDSGKGGFYFRPDPLTDPNRVAWKPVGQR